MNYLAPNDAITVAKWNDLFTQADAVLTSALGGLSAVFANVGDSGPSGALDQADKQWDRAFFFGFDPVNPPTTLHPLALVMIQAYLGIAPAVQQVMYWRQYSHSAITGQLSGLSQLSNTAKWNVVKLQLPTWAAWSAAIYPSGFGSGVVASGMYQTISSVVYPAYNCLDVSLQVHKATVSSTPYNVTFNDVTTAEHAQPLKPIEVFTLGNFTWDTTNWDKYSVVRVHNCGKTAATATFGSASATLPAGASKCFRKLATGWIVCLNYFHTAVAGDGRFLQMRDVTLGTASIFMPGIVADVLARVFQGGGDRPKVSKTNFEAQFDPARMFDMSSVYNNAGYTKQSVSENTPPSGGYFPALAANAPLGDFIIHRGKVLVANRAVPNTVHATQNIIAAPTAFTFADGTNTVANVSNMAVFNVTTAASIPAVGTPGNPATTNWTVNYGILQFAIIPQAGYITTGDVLRITFDYIPPDDHVWVDFDSFATLATKLQAAGLSTRALSESNPFVTGTVNNLEIYSSLGWHIVDLSCPLVTFLTGGAAPLPAIVVGSTQSSSPKSLKLPWLVFAATTLVNNPSSTNFSYRNWGFDSSGNYVLSTTVNVTLNNAGSTSSFHTTIFLPTDAVSTLEAWITSQSQAGGILSIGNFQLVSTTFGHALLWEEVWPLDAKFTAVRPYDTFEPRGNVRTIRVIVEPNVGLHVTRAAYLNETRYMTGDGFSQYDEPSPYEHGIFPTVGHRFSHPPSARRFMFWNYARADRQFQNSRWFQHLSADSPWMPSTGWHNTKSTIYSDELSTNEFTNVGSFYEATPIGADTVGAASARAKATVSRMGTFSRTADVWSPFAYWLQKVTTLTYPNGASTGSISTGSGWYASNSSAVMSNSPISDPIPNVLPCQMEHYNTVASILNGLPPMKLQVGTSYGFNPYGYKVPNYNALTSGGVDGTGKVPREAFYFWSYTPGTDPTGDYYRAFGLTPQTTLPDGYTSTTHYEWLTIADARTLYGLLNIPFLLDATAVPLKWINFTVSLSGGGTYSQADWFNDAAGAWFQNYDARSVCSASSPLNGPSRSWGGPNGTAPAQFPVMGIVHHTSGGFPGGGAYDAYYYYPAKIAWDWVCVVILAEGIVDKAVTCLPQNCAYGDFSFAASNINAYDALGGAMIPVIVDNTIEASLSETTYISGTGGAGLYETIITTNLFNARLVTIPVDGQINNNPNPPPPGGGL